jgi:hypothetical protein
MQKINLEVSQDEIKRLRLYVDTISWYNHFSEGQDGYLALELLKEFVEKLEEKLND